MPSTREYRRIFRRLFVTHLGLALLPLVALGIFSIDRINSIYDEKISAGIEAVCSSKHRALDTFLHERVSQIKTLAFTHDLAELRDPDRLSRIFTVMQQSGRSFVDLGIIGMDGRHISYVGPFDLRDANYVNAPWFTEVLRKGVFVSDVFMGRISSSPSCVMKGAKASSCAPPSTWKPSTACCSACTQGSAVMPF